MEPIESNEEEEKNKRKTGLMGFGVIFYISRSGFDLRFAD